MPAVLLDPGEIPIEDKGPDDLVVFGIVKDQNEEGVRVYFLVSGDTPEMQDYRSDEVFLPFSVIAVLEELGVLFVRERPDLEVLNDLLGN
ncbi:MAG TPA: hypothetical protein ENL34_09165 [Chloroflexi bacterium]|nr:hypothetical protein [Chloroflexota bacterium]